MLRISDLKKSFGGHRVLAGVDLEVAAGESVALLGGNGCGKTTTLSAIVGLAVPDAGEIFVDGVDARSLPKEARRRMSFLPQKSHFPATLTARETLEAVARLRGLNGSRVEEEIDFFELPAGQSVATLSGGQRQRLALAAALLPDVPLFLFDEPSANLDPRSLGLFLGRARALRAEGKALLFTTHVSSDVESLATRVAILNEGRIEAGEVDSVFEWRGLLSPDFRGRREPIRESERVN